MTTVKLLQQTMTDYALAYTLVYNNNASLCADNSNNSKSLMGMAQVYKCSQ